jgi:hypothetical protein
MTIGFYEKAPSLSLRLRVPRGVKAQQPDSNNLGCHSSLFDLIQASDGSAQAQSSNELELSRMCLNNLERRRDVAYG